MVWQWPVYVCALPDTPEPTKGVFAVAQTANDQTVKLPVLSLETVRRAEAGTT
jgi:hypothetical protein